jgi:hypothetical protein
VFRSLRWTCLRVCSHPLREQLFYVYNDYKQKLQITIMVPTTLLFWSVVATTPQRRVSTSLLLLSCTDSSCSYAGGASNSFNREANPFHMPLLVRVPQVRYSSCHSWYVCQRFLIPQLRQLSTFYYYVRRHKSFVLYCSDKLYLY